MITVVLDDDAAAGGPGRRSGLGDSALVRDVRTGQGSGSTVDLVDLVVDDGAAAWDWLHGLADRSPGLAGHVEARVVVHDPLFPLLRPHPCTADTGWAHGAMRADAALQLLRRTPGEHGQGIRIGHPDTGWAPHFQLPEAALDLDSAYSAFADHTDARDPLETVDLFDGHGTGTASLLVSGDEDRPPGRDSGPDPVVGLCRNSRVVPVRCANSVVAFSDVRVTSALRHLVRVGVDVVSISLGGPPSPSLARVLHELVWDHGVVVVAAGGQRFPVVPYPAAYPDCIAVAASTARDRPWQHTTPGSAIDVAAPGHLVCVADFAEGRHAVVKAGSGTSYATPHVAAAAALWLAHHGRDALRDRYARAQPVQEVFRSVLTATARTPGDDGPAQPGDARYVDGVVPLHGWRRDRFGAGILDLRALLTAPLPPPLPVARPAVDDPVGHWTDALRHVLGLPSRDSAMTLLDKMGRGGGAPALLGAELTGILLALPATTLTQLRSVAAGEGATATDRQRRALAVVLSQVVRPAASGRLSACLDTR